ncbi:regulator of G-protein signaling 22 [Xenentodon cancila]
MSQQESSLASDDVLVNSFNDFLRLPCFSEGVLYNQDTGRFELVNGAAETVSSRIRTVLRSIQADLLADAYLRHLKCERSQELHSSQTDLGLSFTGPSAVTQEDQHLRESQRECCQMFDSAEQQLEYLDAVSMVGGLHLVNTKDSVNKSGHQKNWTNTESKKEVNTEWNKKNRGSRVKNQEYTPDFCWDDRPDFNAFKEFLQGTHGEKLLCLWMDIERLKAAQHRDRKNRYLVLMRNWYLQRSSRSSLNVELLSRLGLTTSSCWTEESLLSVQPVITRSLLCYWANRFWMSHRVQEDTAESPRVGLQTVEGCYGPVWSFRPCSDCITPSFSKADTCSPQPPRTAPTELLSSRARSPCSGTMQKLLDVLFVESRSGSYFTHFCEQSGNQLWVNTVYLWTDLQRYREMFQQDELDPYMVQREAQILYSTYICSFARRSVDMDEELRTQVYDRLLPAFEELFDRVEEHVLNVLLEPWTLLVSRDKESFRQLCVQEEVRCINSQEFRELRSLYEESARQLKQMEKSESLCFPSATHFSNGSDALDSWASVSSGYHSNLLGPILGQSCETGYFMSFLQSQGASIHLTCWLDLEQYKRTPHTDRAIRQERSSRVVTKYLNEKYFFGADSPATAVQQDDILRSTGGLEHLTSECLSDSVVVAIQDIIRTHLEETWLPPFLSTTKSSERQKRKPERQAADTFSQKIYRRQRARKDARKFESLWMSSSKEILLFRQLLLNPAACQQFQHFVSLKGDFLENDVRFWVEVQRYKDLCHSHCDEATIQQKISTIISCFINSSVPPALQIDIPPDQAQRILEKRHELGPYIFREAQMSVFSELLKFWAEFQMFSSSIQEEEVLPLLHEKRVKFRAKLRRQRRKEEEEIWRRAQLLQSYSKYMAGLKKEEVLLRNQSQLATSSSTLSEPSTDISVNSARSKGSCRQPSRSSSMDDKQKRNGDTRQ